jgi:hypothetical protein
VNLARVRGDRVLGAGRRSGVELSNLPGKRFDICGIDSGSSQRSGFLPLRTHFRVALALRFGAVDGLGGYEQPLPFISLPATAETKDDNRERGVTFRAPRDAGITRTEKCEMPEIRAIEAKAFLPLFAQHVSIPESALAFITL